jgi:hypothetical protein
MNQSREQEKGSIELIVMGLLAALIVVLAIPFLTGIGKGTKTSLNDLNASFTPAP